VTLKKMGNEEIRLRESFMAKLAREVTGLGRVSVEAGAEDGVIEVVADNDVDDDIEDGTLELGTQRALLSTERRGVG
jgi:hypothetical protein